MATITDWIAHLTTDTDGATEGIQVGSSIYPGVGTEFYLVIALVVIWVGWHFLQHESESKQLKQLAKKRPSANDYKSNITDW